MFVGVDMIVEEYDGLVEKEEGCSYRVDEDNMGLYTLFMAPEVRSPVSLPENWKATWA